MFYSTKSISVGVWDKHAFCCLFLLEFLHFIDNTVTNCYYSTPHTSVLALHTDHLQFFTFVLLSFNPS